MIGVLILGVLVLVAGGFIWFMSSENTLLDDILRERADYDIWLRRNALSETKERENVKQKDDLEHQSKIFDLKKEVDRLENLLGKNK